MEPLNLASLPKYLSDEAEAWLLLERLRWNGRPVCPHCGVVDEKHYFIAARSGQRVTKKGNVSYRRLWKCRDKGCRKQFSVLVGTIFEDSRLPVSKWLLALYLYAAAKNAISAKELERHLGVAYATAWFVLHRLREAGSREPLAALLSGTVVVDETYVGGKPHNKHRQGQKQATPSTSRPGKSSAADTKVPVVALIDRDSTEVRTSVVTTVNGDTLRSVISGNVKMAETVLHTDGHKAYRQIGQDMAGHEWVDHSAWEYVRRDGMTTNMVESFFAQFKRSIDGTYHAVSPKHLHRYADEFAFRWNTRKMSDFARIEALLAAAVGKRLTYRPVG